LIWLTIILACIIAWIEIRITFPGTNITKVCGLAFFVYGGFHVGLALLIYAVIPSVFSPSFFGSPPIIRALIAGIGYPIVFKSRFFDIKVGEKKVPVGPALFYDFVSNALLDRVDKTIENRMWKDAFLISASFPTLETYVFALNAVWRTTWSMDMGEEEKTTRQQLQNLRDRIVLLAYMDKPDDKSSDTRAVRAAMLLINHFRNKKNTLRFLKDFAPR
jgi:hypothetical protein